MCSGKANDWRTRESVVLDLLSNFKLVRSTGFFGEPLGQVRTLRGQILTSRTGDDPCTPCVHSKRTRVHVQSVPVCRFKTCPRMLASRAHVFQHVRVVPVHTRTIWTDIQGFFSVPHHTRHTAHTHTTDTTCTPTRNITRRERQREKTEKERERQEKDKTKEKRREERRRQDEFFHLSVIFSLIFLFYFFRIFHF